jgi:translation initiation factor 2 subunit 1
MSVEMQEFPEVGEIVLATITKVIDHGAYVSLDEYNNVQGFLHVSEIAPGWVRTVGKYVKPGEKKVLLVKKVIPERSEIDLSLKQISKDQKKKKLLEVKKFEKGKTLIQNVAQEAKLSEKEIEKLEEELFSKYDSVYDAFMDVARNGIKSLEELKISKKILYVIEDVSTKIKLPSVEIRGILELASNKPNGVEIIKKILLDVINDDKESNIVITYIGAPKYRLSIKSHDFKSAEKKLKPILVQIQDSIEKQKGTFKFTREESKKTREG